MGGFSFLFLPPSPPPPSSLRKLSATTAWGAFSRGWGSAVNQREKGKTGLVGVALSDFFSLLHLRALDKMTAWVMHEITHVID